ncbi:cell division zipA domain protein [Neisseria meningitidis 992008]|nr:cell division zipA domain protein [Neisseria meningitidis 992008]
MIYIVLFLAAVLAVVAYNMYQENQYRKKVCDQFGHSDKDALLNSKTSHVRDGKPSGGSVMMPKPQPAVKKTAKPQDPAMRNLQEQDAVYIAKQKQAKASPFKTESKPPWKKAALSATPPTPFPNPKPDIPHRNLPTRRQNLHPFRKHLQNR